MINASAEFKQTLKDGGEIKTYADITLSDGTVLHLTPGDIWLGGCTIDDKTTDGKFGVGFVIGKTLSLRIANHDERFSLYDFYSSIINLYVAMQLENGTVEKIRKGVYYTTIPETPGEIIEISAADGMYKLDRDYANSNTEYPASLQTIITDACLDCGIPIGFRQFDNMSYVVQEKPEKVTYRQVVSWACQIAGYNARIDNNGYMQLVWYNTALLDSKVYDGGDFLVYPHDTELDGGDFFDYGAVKIIDGGLFTDAHPEHIFRFKNLTVHTDDVVITGVQVIREDTDVLFGETGYVIKVENNPFVSGRENQVADYLGRRMVGMYFRPFSGSVLGNPLYEPFDVCKVSDRKGNAYQSIINSVSYTVGSYTEIACQAEDPVRNGSDYYSAAAAAVVEARRNTEKQLAEYDKAVQSMNQIAMNAMGFHTTYEEQPDGSRITYLHDKPTLAESKIVYKQTIDGFFVSQDGGKSYTAGFDSQGNAVVNILYAIGIVADWIHSGVLTLGGNSNINGILQILDASGAQIGRWDKDGIHAIKGEFTGSIDAIDLVLSGTMRTTYTTINNAGYITSEDSEGRKAVYYQSGMQVYDKAKRCRVDFGANIFLNDSAGMIFYDGNGKEMLIIGTNIISTFTWKSFATFDGPVTIETLSVTGSKYRIVKTKNFGTVCQSCYEMSFPMFGDIGTGKTDETGLAYIYLDQIFQETVTSDITYYVFLQKEGRGDIWVEEKMPEYFLVKGTPGLSFSWEIKVKQRDYEYDRMETYDENKQEAEIDYESQADNYLNNYERKILDYEEIN